MIGCICVSKILQSTLMGMSGPTASHARFRDAYIARSALPYFDS